MKYTKVEKGFGYPSWCCQECGEAIGYLGRFFQLFKPFSIYKMFHTHTGQDTETGRIVMRNVSLVGLILVFVLSFFI